MLLTGKL